MGLDVFTCRYVFKRRVRLVLVRGVFSLYEKINYYERVLVKYCI